MKKIILSMFVMVVSISSVFSWDIVSITKSGGKTNGGGSGVSTYYMYKKELCTRAGVVGYCISCSGNGAEVCNSVVMAGGGSVLDEMDAFKANELANYVEQQIAGGTLTGTFTEQVQVEGENFVRAYTASWTADSSDPNSNNTVVISRLNLN